MIIIIRNETSIVENVTLNLKLSIIFGKEFHKISDITMNGYFDKKKL